MSNYISLRRDLSNNFQEHDIFSARHSKLLNLAVSIAGTVSMQLTRVGKSGYAWGLSKS
jgi:hypothetical protein